MRLCLSSVPSMWAEERLYYYPRIAVVWKICGVGWITRWEKALGEGVGALRALLTSAMSLNCSEKLKGCQSLL